MPWESSVATARRSIGFPSSSSLTPQLSTHNESPQPAALAITRISVAAMGLLHMLPWHTKINFLILL